MTAIAQALAMGRSAKQILSYLSQHNPQLAQKITQALNVGHSVDHILNYIQKNQKLIGKLIPDKPAQPQNLYKKAQQSIHPSLIGIGQMALGAAAAAGGVYALSRALPNALKNFNGMGPLSPALSQTLSGQSQALMPSSNIGTTQQPPNVPQATAPVSPTIPQPAQPIQPEGIITNAAELLSKENIKNVVDSMLKTGTSPKDASQYFDKHDRRAKKAIEKATGQPFEKVIEEYAKKASNAPQKQSSMESEGAQLAVPKEAEQVTTNTLPESNELVEEPEEEMRPIAKGTVVNTPHGVGEVLANRNGKTLVEIDGKKHQINENEIETSPISEKDLAELHDDLLRGIETETGEDVSRMVQWAGYNPDTNTLQFLPHTGKLYKYSNISPEDAALLRDILSVRKTSGSNFIGAWKKDSKSPIGAALSKLIRRLQSERGGKGNEYEETHETIYSAYEPAIEFKKNKKKNKKKKK